MVAKPRKFASFEAAFALSFEEEISGETYFDTFSKAEPDSRKAALWAKLSLVEKQTVAALRPVVTALGIKTADEAMLRQSGIDEAKATILTWDDFMERMVNDYPVYVTEFEFVKAKAPPIAKQVAQLLIDHEVAMIDMARAELAGEEDPGLPLDAYLDRLKSLS